MKFIYKFLKNVTLNNMSKDTTQDEWAGGKEVESNWFKFTTVGDKVKGTLIAKTFQKSADTVFPDQYIYDLKKADGVVTKVGVSVKKVGTVDRLNSCKLGDIIGIVFETETPSKSKGFAATKNLKVLSFGIDDSYFTGGLEKADPEDVPFK